MCGIAGRFHPVTLETDPSWHHKADALLAHRGPDGSGHYVDGNCELVHRRLALIDVSAAGNQPMVNEDGTVYTIYNGEIYNHRDLRRELQGRGHQFRSTADTEVLVHLYEEYEEKMVEHLRGMFAFAIYDRPRKRLLLARDRFGVKPLYYSNHQGQWLFASEMKAILAFDGFTPQLDHQACYDFLSLGYVPEPLTGFKNIQVLPKGTTLMIDAKEQRSRKYYSVHAQPKLGQTLDDAVSAVEEILIETVRLQSVADVPVAALLSGGIDSSLVVGAYRKATDTLPQTFNVRFPDKAYDETEVALLVSKHYQTRHSTIDLRDSAITPESMIKLLGHFDQPFADSSLIPMYWVSKAIREQGIICTLSGDGGDEAFGGYGRFWRANRLIQMMNLPSWVQNSATTAGSHLTAFTQDWGRQMTKAMRLAQSGQKDSAVLLAGLSSYLSEQQKQDLVRPAARDNLQSVTRHFDGYQPPGVSDLETLSQRITENLFTIGLPSDMLRKVDMMSMLASIEVRVPFLDEEVVALGLQLQHRFKTDGKKGKLVLRRLAAKWLPQQVAAHPKQGFSIPLDVLAPDSLHTMLSDLLLASDSRVAAIFNITLVREWLEKFKLSKDGQQGGAISRGGLYQRIFMLLALELWLRQHRLAW
jgi:asparagine synthase (glutamine-hydrolysing)